MTNIAIYPGTFDPITYGHIDLVGRALRIFDKVIIAIAINQNKAPLFTLAERVELAKDAFKQEKKLEISGFNALLSDFAQEKNANVILRGLRTVTDFDYEFQLASMNRVLNSNIETLFLMPAEKYMYISSSLVREIAAFGGDVSGFVPPHVTHALAKKFKKNT